MTSFHLIITTPDGLEFDGMVQTVRLRMIDGDAGLLANHEDYVSAIGEGECVIQLEDGTKKNAACIGGMVTMVNGEAKIIATTFEWAEDIDLERAQHAKENAEQRLAEAKENTREIVLAEAKLRRALVRIKVKS